MIVYSLTAVEGFTLQCFPRVYLSVHTKKWTRDQMSCLPTRGHLLPALSSGVPAAAVSRSLKPRTPSTWLENAAMLTESTSAHQTSPSAPSNPVRWSHSDLRRASEVAQVHVVRWARLHARPRRGAPALPAAGSPGHTQLPLADESTPKALDTIEDDPKTLRRLREVGGYTHAMTTSHKS